MSLAAVIMGFWIFTCCLWVYRESILQEEIDALHKQMGIIDLRNYDE